MNVLFVDTYGTMKDIVVEYLRLLGHDGIIAETDTKAIEVLQAGPVEAAVVNFKRPSGQRNGYRLILELWKLCPDLRVMVLTGFTPTFINEMSSEEFRKLCKDFAKLETLGVPICRKEGLNFESFSASLKAAKSGNDVALENVARDSQAKFADAVIRPGIV